MSYIIDRLKCEHCKTEFNVSISFGHFFECFLFKWICEDCNQENAEWIHSFELCNCWAEERERHENDSKRFFNKICKRSKKDIFKK